MLQKRRITKSRAKANIIYLCCQLKKLKIQNVQTATEAVNTCKSVADPEQYSYNARIELKKLKNNQIKEFKYKIQFKMSQITPVFSRERVVRGNTP